MTATNLQGRVALVTGAGVGIGRAIAESLAGAGAFVGLHFHHSADEASQTLATIEQRGGKGVLLQADLGQPDEPSQLVDTLATLTGRLDILINNAGSPVQRARIEDCSLELWQEGLAINLAGAILVTQLAM